MGDGNHTTARRSRSRRRRTAGEPVNIAVVGAGSMGRGLFYQSTITAGVRCVAVADLDVGRARDCVEACGRPARVVDSVAGIAACARRGEVAVCEDGGLPARSPLVEVFVESSSSIGPAAGFAIAAIEHGQHLVLMNSEVDLAFGPYLLRLAHRHGVTYTSCDGDQHTVLKRLIDEIAAWGFALVMAGNLKGFLDRYANPATIVPEADKRGLSYAMCTAYTDGTKLNIEMALLANALGLTAPRPGMHGPRAARVREVHGLLDVPALWRSHGPFVDYLEGAEPGGGVFAIGHCDQAYQRRMLAYYKMGDGPFYLFYRPYHLCHIEAMRCIQEAASGRSLLAPAHGLRTNVFAYAKRELAAGESLDGIGGYTCYGLIDNCRDGGDHDGLPICLAEGVTLTRAIPRDAPIPVTAVRFPAGARLLDLHRKAQAASRELVG